MNGVLAPLVVHPGRIVVPVEPEKLAVRKRYGLRNYNTNTAVTKEKEHREDWSVGDVLARPEKLQDRDISNLAIPVFFFVYEA